MIKCIIIAFVITFICCVGGRKKHLYDDMANLSTYERQRGDVRRVSIKGFKCKPLKLWYFSRHGTRLPSGPEIAEIKSLVSLKDEVVHNHEHSRGSLTCRDLERIKSWTFDPAIEANDMYLAESGWNETQRLAKRYAARYPDLLKGSYSPGRFYFQHSATQRTAYTTYAFIDALFGVDAHKYVKAVVTPAGRDLLLNPFDGSCKKLSTAASLANTYFSSGVLFSTTEPYQKALEKISKRLGFYKMLPPTKLIALFGACAYENAWNQESNFTGAWCAALGKESVYMGEYFWDLLFQSMSGYGDAIRERAGCGPVKDLWERFATARGELNIDHKREDVAAFFSHDAVIMLVHTALGLIKDEPPISPFNVYEELERKWKTSEVAPFGANLAAVLHKCVEFEGANISYKVLMLRNERPWLGIPKCPKGVCSWQDFKKLVKPVADKCNYDNICKVS